MGQHTDIEWCDSTLNLQMGCDGCELWNPKLKVKKCYAGQLTERWGGENGWPVTFGQPKLFLHRLDDALRWPDLTGKERPKKPWLNGMPRTVFLDDMGDTFTESLPLDWLAPLLPRMGASPHQWLLLTKRANRMEEFSKLYPFPANFWLMTSITSNANLNRIAHLLRCRGGSHRCISYEPALELVDFTPYMSALSQIIVGGESGAGARAFDFEIARDTLHSCALADVPCFIKQGGSNPYDGSVKLRLSGNGTDMSEWPEDVRVREVPYSLEVRAYIIPQLKNRRKYTRRSRVTA